MRRTRQDDAGDREIAELAALADGSLAPERRAALEARVAASPELADRLAEQQRAVALARGAAAEVEAPASLRARIEAQQRARRARGAAAFDPGRRGRGCRAGRRDRAERARLGQLAPSASMLRSRPTDLVPGADGEATLTKTSSGWRIELDATGLPRLDGGRFYEAWLRNAAGVLVPIGTFNEGRERHALGGRVAEGLHDADRHARAGRRRSGLVGREGARRNGRHRRLIRLEPPVDAAHDLLAGAVEAAHHRPLADPQRSGRLLVREAGDVDGDEDVAEVVGERGDRGVELAAPRARPAARAPAGRRRGRAGRAAGRDAAGAPRSASGSGTCCAARAGGSRGRPRCGAGAGARARARRSPGRDPRRPRGSRRAPRRPGRAGRGGLRAGRGRAGVPSGVGGRP